MKNVLFNNKATDMTSHNKIIKIEKQ